MTLYTINFYVKIVYCRSSRHSSVSTLVSGRLHDLARRFSTRTEFFKNRIGEPVSPDSDKRSASGRYNTTMNFKNRRTGVK